MKGTVTWKIKLLVNVFKRKKEKQVGGRLAGAGAGGSGELVFNG